MPATKKKTVPPDIRRIREAGRVHRANVRAEANAAKEVAITTEASRIARHTAIYSARRINARQEPIERYKGRLVTRAADTAISTATPSSKSNVIMVFLFTMAGLIVLYNLVTKGPALSGFLGGLGDWLSLLTTTTPIFRVNPKGYAQNMPQSQPNTQSQPKSSSNEVTK